MGDTLDKEFQWYLKNQDALVKKYNGKHIVIKEEQVLGAYDSDIEAVVETKKHHKLGTFLIQKCELGDASYTMTFHSRVVFA